MKALVTLLTAILYFWAGSAASVMATPDGKSSNDDGKSAKQLAEINRNIAAYEAIDRIGAREFKAIMSHVSYAPKDCSRIWAGKRPYGTYVSRQKIVYPLDREICDDWAGELHTWFKSFGYSVPETVFHAKELWNYRGTPPIDPQVAGHYLAVYQNSLPERVEACYDMPHTQQQYKPELETIEELSKDVTYPYLDQTGTGHSILTFTRCVPVPEYLFTLDAPAEDIWPDMQPRR